MNANRENAALADNPAVKLLNAMHERYRWRPIAELHEDMGSCVGIDIRDPGYVVVVHANDTEPDAHVTHFTRFAPLTNEQANVLLHQQAKLEADLDRIAGQSTGEDGVCR